MTVFHTLAAVATKKEHREHWIQAPFSYRAYEVHENVEKDLAQPSQSKCDFAARTTWLVLDSLFVNPLIVMACFVEGVFRLFAGLVILGVSLIKFEGNREFRAIGKGMLRSTALCGQGAVLALWNMVKVPSVAMGVTVKMFWTTGCCRQDYVPAAPEVEEDDSPKE